ncbi:putative isoamyl alcohol oxidase [Aspergillus undulatus]|uniref:putative isoamyl alcohol oxidase n=1 Tax=Aspergillus undulatus TaxID=1810928 RepID=UPI003CCCF613
MRTQFLASLPFLAATAAGAITHCKSTPQDATWPSLQEWSALNKSIDGTLLKTIPAASSCYPGNPFASTKNCTDVTNHWSYAAYHASWPESIDYSIFTNHSCLPPGVEGYTKARGCNIGALPQYIVNATNEDQIATAMKWASERNIRIVVKGTGHDMSGRSTGAYSLSIWTHNLNHFHHDPHWPIPGTNSTANVAILGSGNNWGSAYTHVHSVNRTVVGGEDATVGLGGLIQNGGHGLLSSTYGLASDNLYQVTIIASDGRRLVANDVQNQDLFWAVRGAGGGQFGVATEFVLRTHPVPSNVVAGGLTFYAAGGGNVSDAAWDALVETASLIPDLMDYGLTGTVMALTGSSALTMLGLDDAPAGPAATISLTGFNMTTDKMNTTIDDLALKLKTASGGKVSVIPTPPTTKSYWASTKPNFLASQSSGASSMITSRLLGRRELSDIPADERRAYLQAILTPSSAGSGSMALFGLQGGPGTARTPRERRGSAHPAWRSAYAHFMTYGAPVNATADASSALAAGAEWYEKHIEPVWREWAPNGGSYANEGNVFSKNWKEDFYGVNYDRLLEVKREYDPAESLFVWAGVGSDEWVYDLHSGLLCRGD